MFEHVVVSGCSLCWGDELQDRDQRYSSHVAKHFNANLHDFSMRGIGNESISFRIIDGVLNLISKNKVDKSKVLVIASWSYFTRLNYFNPKSKKFLVLSSVKFQKLHYNTVGSRKIDDHLDPIDLEFYYKNHDDISFFVYNTLKHIYMTQLFLERHGIKYVFTFNSEFCYKHLFLEAFRSVYGDNKEDGNKLPNVLNMANQIDRENIHKTFFGTFTDDNRLPEGPKGHPLEKAHEEYGKLLIKFIEDRYAEANH